MKDIKEFTCAIFDMDGCLVDTEAAYRRAWSHAAASEGLIIEQAVIDTWAGVGIKNILKEIEKLTGNKECATRIWQHREEFFFQMLESDEISFKPYAREMLEFLRAKGIRLGLASSTFTPKASRILNHFGLTVFFDFMVFGDEVNKVKPAPDIYLEALRRSGREMSNCIVFEDSPSGIMAAAAAGFEAIVHIPDSSVPQGAVEQPVLLRVKDFSEVIRLLKNEG